MELIKALLEALKAKGRELVEKEPARVVGFVTVAVAFVASKLAEQFGIVIPADIQAPTVVVLGWIVLEVIRHLVYSPATVDELTGGGN